jgi:hypothetical protein
MAGESTQWVATARALRRAGFGVTGPEVDAALTRDWPAYVDAMLGANPDADPGASKRASCRNGGCGAWSPSDNRSTKS